MTEPRKLQTEHKGGIPTPQERGAYKRQAELYAEGIFESYRHCQPMPAPDAVIDDLSGHWQSLIDRMARVGQSAHKTAIAMEWWRQYGQPVLVNKLRGRAQAPIFSLNDLIHPETLERMSPETPGCGCVR